jgi:hypothetical protein
VYNAIKSGAWSFSPLLMRNWHASVSPVQFVKPQPIWAMLLIFSITCQHFQKNSNVAAGASGLQVVGASSI